MNENRLTEIELKLKRLYERKSGMENARDLYPLEERTRVNQRIREEVDPQIRDYEREYWQIIDDKSKLTEIPEAEAEIVVAEFVEGVGQIQGENEEIINYLKEILARIEQSDETASAKLKVIISSIPPFVGISFEPELDIRKLLGQYFPKLNNRVQGLKKK